MRHFDPDTLNFVFSKKQIKKESSVDRQEEEVSRGRRSEPDSSTHTERQTENRNIPEILDSHSSGTNDVKFVRIYSLETWVSEQNMADHPRAVEIFQHGFK